MKEFPFLLLVCAALSGCLFHRAQKYKQSRDRLFLATREIETGKVLSIDSQEVRLRKSKASARHVLSVDEHGEVTLINRAAMHLSGQLHDGAHPDGWLALVAT